MAETCTNTGNWVEMCESLSEVTKHKYGDIQSAVMSCRETGSRRLAIVAGRYKKNRVRLNSPFQMRNSYPHRT